MDQRQWLFLCGVWTEVFFEEKNAMEGLFAKTRTMLPENTSRLKTKYQTHEGCSARTAELTCVRGLPTWVGILCCDGIAAPFAQGFSRSEGWRQRELSP